MAYRLTPATRRRLGYHDRRTAGIHGLQHRLDTVQSVCALVRPTPDTLYPVQGWLTESMARGELGAGVEPDSMVVVRLPTGSAVLCLEIDEATQHAPVIRHKLRAYRKALRERAGYLLLFVVPGRERRQWLQRQAGAERELHEWSQGWLAELPLLDEFGLEASVWPLGARGPARQLNTLIRDVRPRLTPTPVGSPDWLRLLGSGGGEDFEEALR